MAIIKGELKQSTGETTSDTLFPKTSADNVTYDNTSSGLVATDVQGAIDEIGNAKELYWCTYGTTTYAQITQALSDGKLPIVNYSNRDYLYQFTRNDGVYAFTCVDSLQLTIYHCYITTNSNWSIGNKNIENTNNKVTTISSSSTNTQYPSAKCVYDAIPQIQINGASIVNNGIADIQTNSAYNSSSNKIATMGDIPSIQSFLESLDGYRDVGTQTLKNINGEFVWVTDT